MNIVNIEVNIFTEEQSQLNPISTETWETWFQRWLKTLATELPPAPGYELSLRLTDDAEIHQLNHQYRDKDQPTDVLAFAALEIDIPQPDEEDFTDPLYLGDIVISLDTAQHQAEQQQHSLEVELAWLAAHGLLHLLGWDHPDEESLQRMWTQQEQLLSTVDLALSC